MNSANAACARFLAIGTMVCVAGCAEISRPTVVSQAAPLVIEQPARPEVSAEKTRSDPPQAASPVMILMGSGPVREAPAVREPEPLRDETKEAARQAKLKWETAQVRQRYVDAHPELPEEIRLAILSQKVVPGMTMETAFVSLGAPERATKNVSSDGANEFWSFPGRMLYFEKGILLSYTEER